MLKFVIRNTKFLLHQEILITKPHEPDTPRCRYDLDPCFGSDSGLPLSTSSPTKSRTQKDQSSSRNGQGSSRRSSEDPVSLFQKLEGATGTKSKQPPKSAIKLQDDGQHRDVSNCGCHRCIHEISITKLEKVTPGQGVSEKLWDLIKSRRIYKGVFWCDTFEGIKELSSLQNATIRVWARHTEEEKKVLGWGVAIIMRRCSVLNRRSLKVSFITL